MLSIDQIASYHRDGFLAIEDFATPAACRALRRRADELVDAFEATAERTIFTTDEQERTSNREFIDLRVGDPGASSRRRRSAGRRAGRTRP